MGRLRVNMSFHMNKSRRPSQQRKDLAPETERSRTLLPQTAAVRPQNNRNLMALNLKQRHSEPTSNPKP